MTDQEKNQPVAWRTTTTDGRHTHFTENGRIAEQWSESGFDVTPLFISAPSPAPAAQTKGPADQIISQIEELFPNWRAYRDLVDCITCELHELRQRAEAGR